jgi:hypothetical protein
MTNQSHHVPVIFDPFAPPGRLVAVMQRCLGECGWDVSILHNVSETRRKHGSGLLGLLKGSAAMIMLHAGPAAKGRRVKFTPQVIGKIKEFVAKGISRDEIADRLGVTVGSLQVTCSRLGISLRRSTGSRYTTDVRERTISTPCSVGSAHAREQKEVSQPAARAAPSAKFAITMRHRGKDRTSDIELPSRAIEALALEAMSRDLDIAELIGQVLVAAINKDMIQKILR